MLDREVARVGMAQMPVRIEVLILNGQAECGIGRRVHGGKWWKWICHIGGPIRIAQVHPKEADGRTEWRVLHEIVVKFREGHDVKPAPTAADYSGVFALCGCPGETESRGEVCEVRVHSAIGKAAISGEYEPCRRVRKSLRLIAGNVPADLLCIGIGIGKERIPPQPEIQ